MSLDFIEYALSSCDYSIYSCLFVIIADCLAYCINFYCLLFALNANLNKQIKARCFFGLIACTKYNQREKVSVRKLKLLISPSALILFAESSLSDANRHIKCNSSCLRCRQIVYNYRVKSLLDKLLKIGKCLILNFVLLCHLHRMTSTHA